MRNNAIWPSTLPNILSALGVVCAIVILLGFEKQSREPGHSEINYRRLTDYKLGQALCLLALMVAYALLLRPAGFLLSTMGFLVAGTFILGERKFYAMIPVAALAAVVVWYLVERVLGIFLRPLPLFLTSGG